MALEANAQVTWTQYDVTVLDQCNDLWICSNCFKFAQEIYKCNVKLFKIMIKGKKMEDGC